MSRYDYKAINYTMQFIAKEFRREDYFVEKFDFSSNISRPFRYEMFLKKLLHCDCLWFFFFFRGEVSKRIRVSSPLNLHSARVYRHPRVFTINSGGRNTLLINLIGQLLNAYAVLAWKRAFGALPEWKISCVNVHLEHSIIYTQR